MGHQELKEQYGKIISNNESGIEQFRASCLSFLEKNKVEDCFKLLPLPSIQKDFLERNEDAEFDHLVKVFQIFEKYAANISTKPWCKDLHTIKV
jgi:hypothetical protein